MSTLICEDELGTNDEESLLGFPTIERLCDGPAHDDEEG